MHITSLESKLHTASVYIQPLRRRSPPAPLCKGRCIPMPTKKPPLCKGRGTTAGGGGIVTLHFLLHCCCTACLWQALSADRGEKSLPCVKGGVMRKHDGGIVILHSPLFSTLLLRCLPKADGGIVFLLYSHSFQKIKSEFSGQTPPPARPLHNRLFDRLLNYVFFNRKKLSVIADRTRAVFERCFILVQLYAPFAYNISAIGCVIF